MPEGVAAAGGRIVGDAAYEDRNSPPAADPGKAPYGWMWDRSEHRWRAKKPAGRAAWKAKQQAEAGPPPEPVSSSGEIHQGDRDPDPSWFGEQQGKDDGKKRRSISDVPRETVSDMAGFAGMVGAPLLAMLQQIDPYCGTALANSYGEVVDAVLPLLCRSEKVVEWFSADKSDWLLWGKLALALRPFAQAVLQHHVFRSVDVVRDPSTGNVTVIPRRAGGPDLGDHLVPPVPDFSAYAA
jgi:hypothetical protein